ncbi:IPT/TIG domain-containing protein [Streptomyces sp. NPDC021100]|uniref:IPT/TIG domain-containing protein n=1 Tax=Streptomyces sp. NPDC021100 TaxID=3365114 RepID=UPI00378CC82B
MLTRRPVTIPSVEPSEGREGTLVTIRGTGFAPHVRNNCVVIGGMGACARPEPGSTDTELKVRIGPVARATEGDLLMWPGTGTDVHTERIAHGDTTLTFSEVSVFRNGAPVASAGIGFRLTDPSPHTYAGFVGRSPARVDLGGLEGGPALCVRFPHDSGAPSDAGWSSVDICLVLKEPTLAIDFSAEFSGDRSPAQCLGAVAKAVTANAALLGERVYADVVDGGDTGECELYVTKPYLTNGMFVLRFGAAAR